MMNKNYKRTGIALFVIIIAITGIKLYVNNEMNKVDWNELNKKYQEQERKRNEKIKNEQNIPKEVKLNEIEFKQVNRLYIPLYDYWHSKSETIETSIDLFNVIMSDKEEKGIMSITSQKPHSYIKGLDKLSEYYNEKFIRNLEATGLKLTSKNKETKDFKGVNANYEYFDSKYISTGEENKCLAINFIYQDYVYTIFYVITPEAEQVIKGIELK